VQVWRALGYYHVAGGQACENFGVAAAGVADFYGAALEFIVLN
jgi:hypothetical protein